MLIPFRSAEKHAKLFQQCSEQNAPSAAMEFMERDAIEFVMKFC